ncbi:cytochrome p450 [Colletotrichum chrysophilum]|uniref:Cytochrome p450 n=1 Tax=Colletotrichum chrysophilum TaxID=1836956 RepID=A0AAD9AET3_9PEZI|nr:cytochrome p450 [Colletotrichum chrysophilum]
MLQIVGRNDARVFLSTEVSQNDDWIRYSTGYVLSTFDCIRKIKQWHPMLRPMVYWFLPERKEINSQWACAKKHVKKAMEARQHKGDSLENPPSMLDLLSSGKNSHLATRMDDQVLYQMTLIAVGTVTTHASIVQAVYDLATYPEYIPILREEIQSVSRDHDGFFTKDAVMALKKLDSFMKESQRLSAGDLSTFQREATADLTLPDGTFIPKGTKIEVNTASIHVDEAYYPDPQRFDGLRYYRLRQRPGDENKHMYYSVGKNDLSFGFGRHACPGRYLGHLNIKLVMAELLMEYDVQTTLKSGRPKNVEFEALVAPDPDFEILLKSRRHS